MSSNPTPSPDVLQRASRVQAIFMDVDGVLTRGLIVYDDAGGELKHFNALDGQGIKLAHLAGIRTGVITARESQAVRRRARELGMASATLACEKKLPAFRAVAAELGLEPEQFCYIGDDLPDVPVLRRAGLAVAVVNAVDEARDAAHYITTRHGGEGAVREVIDLVLRARGLYDVALERLWAEE